MASQLNGPDEAIELDDATTADAEDRIDDHLLSALDSPEDDVARYHLREALQLQLAEMQRL